MAKNTLFSELYGELCDVHCGITPPNCGESSLVRGTYKYYHYKCDGFDDRGWGCGYRTLQTICSWMNINIADARHVPSHKEIQDILVLLEDKPATFAGSREWIGSFEVCLVLDHLYNVSSKILHVDKGSNLKGIAAKLQEHFQKFGSPVMMGGDQDASSKGVLGIHIGKDDDIYILILDPHFVGRQPTLKSLQTNDWVKWQHLNEFIQNSFYNLCLPQIAPKLNN